MYHGARGRRRTAAWAAGAPNWPSSLEELGARSLILRGLEPVEQRIDGSLAQPKRQTFHSGEVHGTRCQLVAEPGRRGDVPPQRIRHLWRRGAGQERRRSTEPLFAAEPVECRIDPGAEASGLQADLEHAFGLAAVGFRLDDAPGRRVAGHPIENGGVFGGIRIVELPIGDEASDLAPKDRFRLGPYLAARLGVLGELVQQSEQVVRDGLPGRERRGLHQLYHCIHREHLGCHEDEAPAFGVIRAREEQATQRLGVQVRHEP